MSSRRRAREFALQALFLVDQREVTAPAAIEALWTALLDGEGIADNARPPESEEMEFTAGLVRGVVERRDEIDAIIELCSTNWRVQRMPVVDRNVLRMAAYEIMWCPEVPPTVAINEGIELAKLYGDKDSRAFVNGLLDRVARRAGRIGAAT